MAAYIQLTGIKGSVVLLRHDRVEGIFEHAKLTSLTLSSGRTVDVQEPPRQIIGLINAAAEQVISATG